MDSGITGILFLCWDTVLDTNWDNSGILDPWIQEPTCVWIQKGFLKFCFNNLNILQSMYTCVF